MKVPRQQEAHKPVQSDQSKAAYKEQRKQGTNHGRRNKEHGASADRDQTGQRTLGTRRGAGGVTNERIVGSVRRSGCAGEEVGGGVCGSGEGLTLSGCLWDNQAALPRRVDEHEFATPTNLPSAFSRSVPPLCFLPRVNF